VNHTTFFWERQYKTVGKRRTTKIDKYQLFSQLPSDALDIGTLTERGFEEKTLVSAAGISADILKRPSNLLG